MQVVCANTGESHYPEGRTLPDAQWVRYACPCGCGEARYKDL